MTPAQQKMADKMPESALQEAVQHRCDALGLLWYHVNDSRRDNPGMPDLLIVGKVTLFVELKSMRGRLRPEQDAFMTALQDSGQQVLLWRPEHLFDGAIDRTLRAIAKK